MRQCQTLKLVIINMKYTSNRGLDFIFKAPTKRNIFCPKPHSLLCLVYIIECVDNTYHEWEVQFIPFLIDSYYISTWRNSFTSHFADLIYRENRKRTLPIWGRPWAVFKVRPEENSMTLTEVDCTVSSVKDDSTYLQYLLIAIGHRGGLCVFIESCRCLKLYFLLILNFDVKIQG